MNLLPSGIIRKNDPMRKVRNRVGRQIEIQKLNDKFLSLSLYFLREDGENGRHPGFRVPCWKACEFESRSSYQIYIRETYIPYYEKGGGKVKYTTGFISYPRVGSPTRPRSVTPGVNV